MEVKVENAVEVKVAAKPIGSSFSNSPEELFIPVKVGVFSPHQDG